MEHFLAIYASTFSGFYEHNRERPRNGEERNGNYPIRSVLFSKNFNTSPLKTLRGPLVYQLLKLSPSLVYFVVVVVFFSVSRERC